MVEQARVVLWDVDGTLLDPNGSIKVAIDRTLNALGLPARGDGEAFTGMPLRDILMLKGASQHQAEEGTLVFRRIFLEETRTMAKPYDGVLELMRDLHDDGVLQGLVTTKGQHEADMVAKDFQLEDLLGAIIGDDDVRPVKPHPAPILEALRQLDHPADAAVMVGDTIYDGLAAAAAGVPFIGVGWGHGLDRLHECPHVALVRTVAELRAALDQVHRQPGAVKP